MPNSNKCIQLCTISRIKTKKLANRKINRKKTYMLMDANPHLLSAKTHEYPLGYRGIMNNFIQISNNKTFSSAHLRRFTKTSKRSLNIHMSRVNFDKQYNCLTLCHLGNFECFCCLLMLFVDQLFAKYFQKYSRKVKQFGFRSGPTFCQARSGSKLFANVISRRH